MTDNVRHFYLRGSGVLWVLRCSVSVWAYCFGVGALIYLALFPEIYPFIMVCLPWFWVTVRGNQDGGFSIEIEESPKTGLPDQIAYITFYPHEIRGQYWRIPTTPEKWKWEFIWAWDELMERLNRG